MMRLSTIFFCFLLAAAAAGRYQAEAGVRADKSEIRTLEETIAAEEEKISQLQLEVEVLESSQRLSQLAVHRLDLTSVKPRQLQSAEEFAGLLQLEMERTPVRTNEPQGDFIIDAIAMADFGAAPQPVE